MATEIIDETFKTAFDDADGQDVIAFLTASKKAFQCLTDLVTRMTAMSDSVRAESVSTLLNQQLDQVTFAESAVRQWEQDLHSFASFLDPDRPAINVVDSWANLNLFIEANQDLLSVLQDVPFLTQETQFLVTDQEVLAYPAAALFRIVQAETGEADTIDLKGIATSDPNGINKIATAHQLHPVVAFPR